MGRHLGRTVATRSIGLDIGPVPFNCHGLNDWTEVCIPVEKLEAVWKIVGGQVDKTIRKYPLWIVLVLVYTEGLLHGVGLAPRLEEPAIDYQI